MRDEKRGKTLYNLGVYHARLGVRVRELCERIGIASRMRRYVADRTLALNQRIAEQFYLRTYDLELEQADSYRIWAYRKAAWALDDLRESVADVFAARGEVGVRDAVGVGKGLAREISMQIKTLETGSCNV